MTNAIAILTHALRMLAYEPATTFRVIAPALLLVMLSAVVGAIMLPDALIAFQVNPQDFDLPSASSMLLLMGLGIIGLIGYALMAILWHRHVLLNGAEEHANLSPSAAVLGGYIWRAFILALVQILIALPIALVMILFLSLGGGIIPGFSMVIGVLAGVLFIWFALRLSVILPAAALGKSLRISESWQVTAPIADTLWGLALLLAVLNMVASLVVGVITPNSIGAAMIAQTVLYVIDGLVFVSVLTTLYGHLLEGRPLG